MNITRNDSRDPFFSKIIKTIDGLPYGKGFTKAELAEKFGIKSTGSVDKWGRRCPEIRNRIVYVWTNGGRNRQSIFVAKKHKAKLIESGLAQEFY